MVRVGASNYNDDSRAGISKDLVTAAVTHREKKLELHPHFHKSHVEPNPAR